MDKLQTATGVPEPSPADPAPDVSLQSALAAGSLPEGLAARVDDQVDRFLGALLTEDVHGDAFAAKLDSAFHLGREEIAVTASLLGGRFMTQSMAGFGDSPAFKAIEDLRGHLDALRPANERDRILGLIPFGRSVRTYLRRFEGAGTQVTTALQQLYAARDEMQRDSVEIDACRARLWDALTKLKAAIHFAQQLDERLAGTVEGLRATDAARAKALEQEVLFYVRQNLTDMLTQQAVCVNGYLSLDVLKRSCREVIIGCNRVATTGMSALAVSQTIAGATGNQVKVMNMLSGVNKSVDTLVADSAKQLNAHAGRAAEFAGDPLLGIEKLQEMLDLTYQAMDTMDDFRTRATETMARNNTLLREELQRAESRIDRSRRELARNTAGALDGPVRL